MKWFPLAPLLAALVVSPATADSVLVLPVPGASDTPREKIDLAVTIPARVVPRPEEPQRERVKSSALAAMDFHPFKPIPQRKFVFETLRILKRKRIITYVFDKDVTDREVDLYSSMGPVIGRTYNKLLDIYRKEALSKFGLVAGDIERFQRVVDIFSPYMETLNYSVPEVNRRLEEMIEVLKKTSGRGQIRVTGIREGKDGTTLVEMEIIRGPTYVR